MIHTPTSVSIIIAGVFIVPNKPLGDINLTRFQVTLNELETLTGTMFHSTLDRNQVNRILPGRVPFQGEVF